MELPHAPGAATLAALYREVGFARSPLAYELPDGRLRLIDGHLRRDLDPDMEVEVEILDVNEDEARTLLLSIDPLAALAETQAEIHERLLELTSPELNCLAWPRRAVDRPRNRSLTCPVKHSSNWSANPPSLVFLKSAPILEYNASFRLCASLGFGRMHKTARIG